MCCMSQQQSWFLLRLSTPASKSVAISPANSMEGFLWPAAEGCSSSAPLPSSHCPSDVLFGGSNSAEESSGNESYLKLWFGHCQSLTALISFVPCAKLGPFNVRGLCDYI